MQPFTDAWPDPRLMQRLAQRVRAGDGYRAFIAAGDALALGVLSSRGGGVLPQWAEELADAMLGAILQVCDRSLDDTRAADRVRLSVAAAVLSAVRPHATCACDASIDIWMGWGVGTPRSTELPGDLAGWVLLCLLRRDDDGAAAAVHALLEREPSGMGLILHDWTVAAIQHHGLDREAQSFHHLRMHLTRDAPPGLLLMAALVVHSSGGIDRRGVLPWLDEVAMELALEGTAGCTPIAAMRRS